MTDFEATDGVGLSRDGTSPKNSENSNFFGHNSAFNNVSRKPTGQLFTCQRKTMPGHTLTLITRIKNGFFSLKITLDERIDMHNLTLIFCLDRCCV